MSKKNPSPTVSIWHCQEVKKDTWIAVLEEIHLTAVL